MSSKRLLLRGRLARGQSARGRGAAARQLTVAHDALSESQLRVKLMFASTNDKLDLSDCELDAVPEGVFELTDLQELSLAGNAITDIPEDIAALTSLRRLVLAGNKLRSLPAGIGELVALEGLWAHGNELESLPDGLCALTNLRAVSFAGNAIEQLPNGLPGASCQLTELNLAGNRLRALPEAGWASMTALERLLLHGNELRSLPDGFEALPAFKVLHVMGNELCKLPDSLPNSASLVELNASDNAIRELPSGWAAASGLQSLLLYGNALRQLPADLADAPSLRNLWIEGNPFETTHVATLCSAASKSRSLARLGLSSAQLAGARDDSDSDPKHPCLTSSEDCSAPHVEEANGASPEDHHDCQARRGYFKLVSGEGAAPGCENRNSLEFEDGSEGQRLLVVAFGSAPGEPNWGGLLSRIRKACSEPMHRAFDVLYVVDAKRAWYDGGESDEDWNATWYSRLAAVTERYDRVLMLGDSMGASAALALSPLATAVVAFCPQVHLDSSSIRPCRSAEWFDRFETRVTSAVSASTADIQVFTGTWQHDLDQAQLLQPGNEHVKVNLHPVDSHRLAFVLDKQDRLVPIVHAIIGEQMGYRTGSVRLANLV